MTVRFRILLVATLALIPVTARAQRFTVGAAGIFGQPIAEFADNVNHAFGADAFGTAGIDTRGIFSLRADISYQQYLSKSEPFLVATGFGGSAELESETKSGVLTLGIGPQISAPPGPVRPYIAGTVGFARFATNTSINIPADGSNTGEKEELDDQTISSDFILSLAATAGIAFEVAAFGRGVQIDVGARYHHNGMAKYVSSDGVVYNGSGTPTVTATESNANFVVYRLGVVIPIR